MSWLILATLLLGAVEVVRRSVYLIPTGHVGLVTKKWGREHPEDRFEVRTHGSAGPQADLLKSNVVYVRPPWLYRVERHPMVTIPPGTIGVVVALHGAAAPADRQLARYVECANFSNARAFLLGGGEAGRQPRILTNGKHSINPFVFEVLNRDMIGTDVVYDITADDLKEISIPPGSTGVVTVHEGLPRDPDRLAGPRVPGHASFQYPDRFLAAGGMVGTQEETLHSGGVYRINPWFAGISLMPTKELILHWRSTEGKARDNYDAELDRISVSVEGVEFMFDVSQTVRIPPETAPRLVARLGDSTEDVYGYSASRKPAPIKRFVEGVLSHIVEGNVLTIAREYSAVQFTVSHAAIQAQLETNVRHALAEWGVEAGQTTLSMFEVSDPRLIERLRDAAVAEQRGKILEIDKHNIGKELDIERVRQQIERGRLKLRSAELEDQVELLGKDRVALERFLAQLAKMQVPGVVAGNAESLLNFLPIPKAMEMINEAFSRRADPALPAGHSGQRPRLTPVYVMLDESSTAWVDDLDAGMRSLCGALVDAPRLAGAIRLSVVGYAGDVAERLALQEVRAGVAASPIAARDTARFGAAFEWLLDRIPDHIDRLKAQDFAVHRPQVLFLIGAEPVDAASWQRTHRQLADREQTRYAPDIVACGVGQASAGTIASVATRTDLAFVAQDNRPEIAVPQFCDFARTYVLTVGQTMLDGGHDTRFGCPDGFRRAGGPIDEWRVERNEW